MVADQILSVRPVSPVIEHRPIDADVEHDSAVRIVIAVGDVEDMCKNALAIFKDEETFQGFRANALEQAKKYDISNIVPQYEALYQRVI